MKDMTAAVIIKDKTILLVHNIKHKGLRVEPPGGKKETEDKTLEECVIREVQEELGITIEPEELFGVYETNSPEGKFQVYMYLSSIKSGSLMIREPNKISRYEWCSFQDLLRLKEQGVLVPNLCSALDKLRTYL
jgi:mutator protein MutT